MKSRLRVGRSNLSGITGILLICGVLLILRWAGCGGNHKISLAEAQLILNCVARTHQECARQIDSLKDVTTDPSALLKYADTINRETAQQTQRMLDETSQK